MGWSIYLRQIAKRAHFTPVTLGFDFIGGGHLRGFPNRSFRSISNVILNVDSRFQLWDFNNWNTIPNVNISGIDRLEIVCSWNEKVNLDVFVETSVLFSIIASLAPSSLLISDLEADLVSAFDYRNVPVVHSVRRLHLYNFKANPFEFDTLLYLLPELEHIHGYCSDNMEPSEASRKMVVKTHDHITTLETIFSYFDWDDTPVFFPRLERLRVIYCPYTRNYLVNSFKRFLRTHLSVKVLEFMDDMGATPAFFRSIAEVAPQITHLSIHPSNIPTFLGFLTGCLDSQREKEDDDQQTMGAPKKISSLFSLLDYLVITEVTNRSRQQEKGKSRQYQSAAIRAVIRSSLDPCYLPNLIGQLVRYCQLEIKDINSVDNVGQKASPLAFRILRLHDSLPSCPELDRIHYSTSYTEDGVFREYNFSSVP
jgi:hypothetical protein